VLLAWDTAIEGTERLICPACAAKKWIQSRLTSPHGRKTSLGAFLKNVSRPVSKPAEPYWALGLRSHGKGVFHRLVKDDDVLTWWNSLL